VDVLELLLHEILKAKIAKMLSHSISSKLMSLLLLLPILPSLLISWLQLEIFVVEHIVLIPAFNTKVTDMRFDLFATIIFKSDIIV